MKLTKFLDDLLSFFPKGWRAREDKHSNTAAILNALISAGAEKFTNLFRYHIVLHSPDNLSYEELDRTFYVQVDNDEILSKFNKIIGIIGSEQYELVPTDTSYNFLKGNPTRLTYINSISKSAIIGSNQYLCGLCYAHDVYEPKLYYSTYLAPSDIFEYNIPDLYVENLKTGTTNIIQTYIKESVDEYVSVYYTLRAQLKHRYPIAQSIEIYDILNRKDGTPDGNPILVSSNEWYYDASDNAVVFNEYTITNPRPSYNPAIYVTASDTGELLYVTYPSDYQPDFEWKSRYNIHYNYVFNGPTGHITFDSTFVPHGNTIADTNVPIVSNQFIMPSDEWVKIPYFLHDGYVVIKPEYLRPQRNVIIKFHYIHKEQLFWESGSEFNYIVPDENLVKISNVKIYVDGVGNATKEFAVFVTDNHLQIIDMQHKYVAYKKIVHVVWNSRGSYEITSTNLELDSKYKYYFQLRLSRNSNQKTVYLYPYTILDFDTLPTSTWVKNRLKSLTEDQLVIYTKKKTLALALMYSEYQDAHHTTLYKLDYYNATLYKFKSDGSFIDRINLQLNGKFVHYVDNNYTHALKGLPLFPYHLGYSNKERGYGYYCISQLNPSNLKFISMVTYNNKLFALCKKDNNYLLTIIDIFSEYNIIQKIPVTNLENPSDMTIDDEGYLLIADGTYIKKFQFNFDYYLIEPNNKKIRLRENYDKVIIYD
ncbi:MAG: hypothetical protein ACTSWR_08265 [Candidatus Helarchaeota archaeon]